ncbi:MAG TPA: Stk1 family PASTA domain-containing Ser/Thr kinase [Firmicutes bacterium]|nr:Stk1 family PASTA domain-containing Ser/Thr kinase [Bacillota bacterium]
MIMKGQKINDRYQIIKSIGEGGMANVYLAYDTILDRDVAVKVLRGDLSNDEKFVRRFQREALNASSLSHPNIVEVYDVGDDAGQYFIVMEYIDGKNLKDLIKKRGKLTTTEVVDIMSQIADGLSVAHDSYIIHRDIKPQNIMILENGLVKITDFGIAMAMNATQLTQTNSVMGSVHYLPPEQASGKGSTLKSDIYSMGILMYELLTGTLPYRGDNAVEIALKHLKEPLPSIREILPDLPQSVENIILKSAAKNPKNRYNDAREMYEDLKTCLDDTRINEPRLEYQYPELDNDNKRFTKQVEKAISVDEEDKNDGEVSVKKVTDSEVKKENKILIFLAAIFVSLVVIVAAFVLFLPKFLNQEDIKIPEVAGKTVSEVIDELQKLGLEVADSTLEASSDTVPKGNVVKTNPPSGAKRSPGTVVTIFVSSGDEKVVVEDYTGKNYFEIKGSLEASGVLVYQDIRSVDKPDDYEMNQIIDQDKKPGEKLGAKDSITLTVPDLTLTYPDFKNYTVKEFEKFCNKNDIKYHIDYVADSSYDDGTIIYQSRPAGYTVVSGSTINITVADSSAENPDSETNPPEDDDCDGLC